MDEEDTSNFCGMWFDKISGDVFPRVAWSQRGEVTEFYNNKNKKIKKSMLHTN